ncbi:MAG: BC1872 family protein [Planctomycetota bacterium]|jgi:hypothetical protein
MEPGPELDALVKKCVMRRTTTDLERFFLNSGLIDRWSPSTSIADAWVVVEMLDGGGPYKTYGWDIYSKNRDHPWRAAVYEGVVVIADAFADTAPHAICLAALEAVGVEPSTPDTEEE